MFDWLLELLRDAWWVPPLLFALIVVDSMFPVLPSETALITVGIIAAGGGLSLGVLIPVAAVAAVVGDSLTYSIGRGPGHRLRDRIFRSARSRERLRWAREQLGDRPWLVAIARFIPGGRTAAAFSAGSLGMPFGRFAGWVSVGAVLWAPANIMLGFLGGRIFQDSFLLPLAVSFALAAGFAAVAEALHRRG